MVILTLVIVIDSNVINSSRIIPSMACDAFNLQKAVPAGVLLFGTLRVGHRTVQVPFSSKQPF